MDRHTEVLEVKDHVIEQSHTEVKDHDVVEDWRKYASTFV